MSSWCFPRAVTFIEIHLEYPKDCHCTEITAETQNTLRYRVCVKPLDKYQPKKSYSKCPRYLGHVGIGDVDVWRRPHRSDRRSRGNRVSLGHWLGRSLHALHEGRRESSALRGCAWGGWPRDELLHHRRCHLFTEE